MEKIKNKVLSVVYKVYVWGVCILFFLSGLFIAAIMLDEQEGECLYYVNKSSFVFLPDDGGFCNMPWLNFLFYPALHTIIAFVILVLPVLAIGYAWKKLRHRVS